MTLWQPSVAIAEPVRVETEAAPEERAGSAGLDPGEGTHNLSDGAVSDPEARAHALVGFLRSVVDRPIRLTITDNRRSMMTSRVERGVLNLRLHHMFLGAEQPVWDALALYLAEDDARAGKVLDAFIEANMHRVRRGGGPIRTAGRVHNLQPIFDRLNQEFFHGASAARVTWGRPGSRAYRRSIQLGCYVAEDDLIRMHPCLDQAFVPELYVSWVLFHEMLHEAFGVEEHNGRRHVHPPAFLALEQTYPDYERAKAWEQQNINRLLRYRPPRGAERA